MSILYMMLRFDDFHDLSVSQDEFLPNVLVYVMHFDVLKFQSSTFEVEVE